MNERSKTSDKDLVAQPSLSLTSTKDRVLTTQEPLDEISRVSDPLIESDMEPDYPTNHVKTSFYTKYNFIPLNLYVQFSKITNSFFLTVLVLLLIPAVSPTTGYTYIFALGRVILASMLKDAFEDRKRHRDDHETNNRIVSSLKVDRDKLIQIPKTTEYVHENEFLVLKKGEEVPADGIMILSFSSLQKQSGSYMIDGKKCYKVKQPQKCQAFSYIETSKIDGESAWKKKYSNIFDTECECKNYRYVSADSFEKEQLPDCLRKVLMKIKELALNESAKPVISKKDYEHIERKENILLKGTIVKSENVVILVFRLNTDYKDISIMKLTKTSRFTEKMYQYLTVVFVIFVCFLIISICFLPFQLSAPYLFIKRSSIFWEVTKNAFTNYISLAYVIPLSLCVMLEVARIFFKLYAQNLVAFCKSTAVDLSISSFMDLINLNKNVNNSITIRNTEVIEQLGSTETIITDKTGTLTLNQMVFQMFYVHSPENEKDLNSSPKKMEYETIYENSIAQTHELIKWGHSEEHILYLLTLMCCNSIYIFDSVMSGTSTDELAILNKITGLKDENGNLVLEIHEKDDQIVDVTLFDNRIRITIIRTLDFSSRLRKMSVLIKIVTISNKERKNQTTEVLEALKNRPLLLTKGSRNSVNCPKLEIPNKYIHLRELILGYQFIDNKTEEGIIKEISEQNDDDEKFKEIFDGEHKFLGITLVEDTLQPDLLKTLSLFKNIFIVTGDKRGTAIGVAKSMKINVEWAKEFSEVTDTDLELKSDVQKYPQKYYRRESLRLDATSDREVYSEIPEDYKVSCRILYNVMPEQKKEIVERIQKNSGDVLAIGDGFNDVPMVKEASIGVGLKGEEGSAASNSADISVTSFNCLIPLVYISRQAYLGFSFLTLNSIMKNLFLIGIHMVLFIYTNGSIYDGSFLAWFNVIFTSMIAFSEACGGRALFFNVKKRFELLENIKKKNESSEEIEKSDNLFPNILQDPSIRPVFSHTRCRRYFLRNKFIFLTVSSILKSVLVFYTAYFMFDKFMYVHLKTVEIAFSYIVFFCIILRQLANVTNINYWVGGWTLFSIIAFFSMIRGFHVFKYFVEISCVVTVSLMVDILKEILLERLIT